MKFYRHEKCITFEEFYEATYKLLLHRANRLLHNSYDAEEVVQDVYFKIAGQFEEYSKMPLEELRKLSFVITKNDCINILKRKDRCNEIPFEINDDLLGDIDYVQDEFFGLYERDYIKNALSLLKDSDREILILKYYDELTYSEIARSLTISEKNVEVKLRRARLRLKEVLIDAYGDD